MISLWISSFLFISGVSVKGEYLFGGIFNEDVHHAAFQVIVDDLNEENSDLPFEITTDLHNVSYDNILEAKKATCSLLKKGVIGIFGPSSTHTSNYIQSICDNKEMPHIETLYDSKIQRNRVVNLHPYPGQIAKCFIHLIVAYQWKRVIILFEDDDSLLRLSPLLELNIEYGIHLLFRQLDKDSSGSYREGDRQRQLGKVCDFFNNAHLDREQAITESTVSKIVNEFHEHGCEKYFTRTGKPKLTDNVNLYCFIDVLLKYNENPHLPTKQVAWHSI